MLWGLIKDLFQAMRSSCHSKTGSPPVLVSDQAEADTERLESAYREAISAFQNNSVAYNQLGILLAKTGRLNEAEQAFRGAILIDREEASFWFNLGRLCEEREQFSDAEGHYRYIIKSWPHCAEAYIRLGDILLRQDRLKEADHLMREAVTAMPHHEQIREQSVRVSQVCAARLDVGLRPKQANLSPERNCSEQKNLSVPDSALSLDYASLPVQHSAQTSAIIIEEAPERKRSVLILCTERAGNVPFQLLFPGTTNRRIKWIVERARSEDVANLPPYDLIFNAAGDPDVTGEVSSAVKELLVTSVKPVLNHPEMVAATARHKLPDLLKGINQVLIPQVVRLGSSAEWNRSMLAQLPLLVRPVHTHGGEKLIRVTNEAEWHDARAIYSDATYVIPYIDYQSPDHYYRKYRIIFVDREPFPYHLAISPQWMAHYYTAEMENHPWKIEEEKAFLQNPESVIGKCGMDAIREIGKRLDLDYGGVDFSVLQDGRILVFEANPTMRIHYVQTMGPLSHKNIHIHKIFRHFEDLVIATV